ncbi:MAG: hypothetical protein IPJ30_28040 [Acidobacteria bacterium]|nr:hypothetical protein [Acidobacteriota bacterium]
MTCRSRQALTARAEVVEDRQKRRQKLALFDLHPLLVVPLQSLAHLGGFAFHLCAEFVEFRLNADEFMLGGLTALTLDRDLFFEPRDDRRNMFFCLFCFHSFPHRH